jgi:xanthine dehydrogenase accessory factor
MDWLVEAQRLIGAGRPFALATVVRRVAPASAQPGAKALILSDGSMTGWVGGSCAQPVVVAEARHALQTGKPRLLRLGRMPGASQHDEAVEYPMTCHSGGALEILIEPVLPSPRLAIVGETPVAATLARLAEVMGFRVASLPHAEHLSGLLHETDQSGFVVVASMGVDDEESLAEALRSDAPYVALVASPKRAAAVRETLAAMGVSADACGRLKAPAGLDIGAETQEEIALSIMAEIASVRATLAPGRSVATAATLSELEPETEAIDPICHMTVTIAGARHTSEYGGRTWYFCCAGCKRRFEADPAQYAAA